jgi:hypothetical protein
MVEMELQGMKVWVRRDGDDGGGVMRRASLRCNLLHFWTYPPGYKQGIAIVYVGYYRSVTYVLAEKGIAVSGSGLPVKDSGATAQVFFLRWIPECGQCHVGS